MLHRVSVSLLAAAIVPIAAFAETAAFAQQGPPSKESSPSVTTVLPASTPGLFLINTSPQVWSQLNRFNPYAAGLPGGFPVPPLLPDFDFAKDVQSWLGDRVAIALLPPAAELETSPRVVVLAPVTNRDRLNAFINKYKASRGEPAQSQEYKGIQILEWKAPPPTFPTEPGVEEPSQAPSSEPPANQNPTQETPSPKQPEPPPPTSPSPPPPKLLPEALSNFLPSNLLALQAISSGFLETLSASPKPPSVPADVPSPPPAPSDPSTIPDPDTPLATSRDGFAVALLPNHVAIANSTTQLEQLIDAQTDSSLAADPLFQRTVRHPQFQQSLFASYGNIAEIAKLLTRIGSGSAPMKPFRLPVPFPALDDAQIKLFTRTYNSADAIVWVTPEGIHTQTTAYYTTPRPDLATKTAANPNQILARLPAISFLSVNSRNFKEQWDVFLKETSQDAETQKILQNLREGLQKEVGLDLEKDIINWMDGEYVFFLFPSRGGMFSAFAPNFDLGVGLMLQTSDRPAAERLLAKWEEKVKPQTSSSDLLITRRYIQGASPVTSWDVRDRGRRLSILSYGWVGEDTLVITSGMQPMMAVNPQPYLPMNLNSTFTTAISSFPAPNEGYFYVNMGASLSFIYALVLPTVPPYYAPYVQEVQRVLGTIRSVSTSNSATADAQRMDTLWVLSPAKQPVKP